MSKKSLLFLLLTHLGAGAIGFALGIYALPILIAPPAPSASEVASMSGQSSFTAEFVRDLEGSDTLHWGEGAVSLGQDYVTLMGSLAPGPDYKLYLAPEFVETEAQFERVKQSAVLVGEVKTFDNFIVPVGAGVDLAAFDTVVVWCETFGEFITAAKYR
ncbi:MAG: DM13 domain-containing protein [Halioglobus sp.]|nr:DM13 domain-containing protein [Halioglobus sp.]